MDFVVRAVSTLPKVTGSVVESNNWRLHEGYPAVDWSLVARLSVLVVGARAANWDLDDWVRRRERSLRPRFSSVGGVLHTAADYWERRLLGGRPSPRCADCSVGSASDCRSGSPMATPWE